MARENGLHLRLSRQFALRHFIECSLKFRVLVLAKLIRDGSLRLHRK